MFACYFHTAHDYLHRVDTESSCILDWCSMLDLDAFSFVRQMLANYCARLVHLQIPRFISICFVFVCLICVISIQISLPAHHPLLQRLPGWCSLDDHSPFINASRRLIFRFRRLRGVERSGADRWCRRPAAKEPYGGDWIERCLICL